MRIVETKGASERSVVEWGTSTREFNPDRVHQYLAGPNTSSRYARGLSASNSMCTSHSLKAVRRPDGGGDVPRVGVNVKVNGPDDMRRDALVRFYGGDL